MLQCRGEKVGAVFAPGPPPPGPRPPLAGRANNFISAVLQQHNHFDTTNDCCFCCQMKFSTSDAVPGVHTPPSAAVRCAFLCCLRCLQPKSLCWACKSSEVQQRWQQQTARTMVMKQSHCLVMCITPGWSATCNRHIHAWWVDFWLMKL